MMLGPSIRNHARWSCSFSLCAQSPCHLSLRRLPHSFPRRPCALSAVGVSMDPVPMGALMGNYNKVLTENSLNCTWSSPPNIPEDP